MLPSFAKATEGKPDSRLALTPKSSFSLPRLFFNGLLVHRSGALPRAQEQQIIDSDWKQYQDWLSR